MISTSSGRCLSKAASSGALQDVWPPTMAPTLVASHVSPCLVTGDEGIHGPYSATTLSMTPASTLYSMKSLILETRCPFGYIVTPLYTYNELRDRQRVL